MVNFGSCLAEVTGHKLTAALITSLLRIMFAYSPHQQPQSPPLSAFARPAEIMNL